MSRPPIYAAGMHATSLVTVSFAVALTLAACEKDESPPAPAEAHAPSASAPPAPTPAPAATAPVAEPRAGRGVTQGSAALKLTGAVTKDLEGPIVTCGFTHLKGRDQGRTWGIRSQELDFQIIASTDEELLSPAAILNVRKPARAHYVFKRKAGKVTGTKDGTLTEIDADLHNLMGKETVHVKGTMTCPPR